MVYVNQDTLGSRAKCLALTEKALSQKQTVVIDNTNINMEQRKDYINFAYKYGARCIAVWINTGFNTCMFQNKNRQTSVSDVVLYTARKKFEVPNAAEGFHNIYTVV
jgi:bifunctional polynucleotide phosphatase/kinase